MKPYRITKNGERVFEKVFPGYERPITTDDKFNSKVPYKRFIHEWTLTELGSVPNSDLLLFTSDIHLVRPSTNLPSPTKIGKSKGSSIYDW